MIDTELHLEPVVCGLLRQRHEPSVVHQNVDRIVAPRDFLGCQFHRIDRGKVELYHRNRRFRRICEDALASGPGLVLVP